MLNRKKISYYDGASILFFAILANLAAQGLYSVVLSIVGVASGNINVIESAYAQIVGMFVIQCFFICAPIVYYKAVQHSAPIFNNSIKNKINPLSVVFAMLIGVVCIVCFYLPAAWFEQFLTFIGYKGSAGINLESPMQIILGIILICIIAPTIEEYIFRGFLLSGLKEKFGTLASVLLSALAFSFMHMSPQQTVYQFILGVVCAYVVMKSCNIGLAICIHSISNFIALMFDLTSLGALFTKFIGMITANWWLSIISSLSLFVIGAVVIYLFCKFFSRRTTRVVEKLPLAPPLILNNTKAEILTDDSTIKQNKMATKFLVISIVVCALMWGFMFVYGLMI